MRLLAAASSLPMTGITWFQMITCRSRIRSKVREVVTESGSYEAKTILADETNDLALLKIESQSVARADCIQRQCRSWERNRIQCWVSFPERWKSFHRNYQKAKLIRLSGLKDESRHFSNQPADATGKFWRRSCTGAGMSGATLSESFSPKSNPALAVLEATGMLPENINHANQERCLAAFSERGSGCVWKYEGSQDVTPRNFWRLLNRENTGAMRRFMCLLNLPWYHPAK